MHCTAHWLQPALHSTVLMHDTLGSPLAADDMDITTHGILVSPWVAPLGQNIKPSAILQQ